MDSRSGLSGVEFRRAGPDEILPLRARLLRHGKPVESAVFSEDALPETLHYGAFSGGTPIGCLTLLHHPGEEPPAWQLRGMGTETRWQGKGVGRALLEKTENDLTLQFGCIRIWCNARAHAVPFYKKMGYRVTSGEFMIPDIGNHYKMEKIRQ